MHAVSVQRRENNPAEALAASQSRRWSSCLQQGHPDAVMMRPRSGRPAEARACGPRWPLPWSADGELLPGSRRPGAEMDNLPPFISHLSRLGTR